AHPRLKASADTIPPAPVGSNDGEKMAPAGSAQREPRHRGGPDHDPIPSERRETMTAHIGNEGADYRQRDDERNHEAYRDLGPTDASRRGHLFAAIDQFERRGADHRGHREEE